MGQYKIEVIAVGGHGCQREIKSGGFVFGCRRMDCPDCIAREFVESLKRNGSIVESAKLTHWPGTPEQVEDDLVTKKRNGSF